MSTPTLQLQTLFVLNEEGRMISTLEPGQSHSCPAFSLIRGAAECVWSVRADVAPETAHALNELARLEPPLPEISSFRKVSFQRPSAPRYAAQYLALVGGRVVSGPAFTFPAFTSPASMAHSDEVVMVQDIRCLERNFQGWDAEEIVGRSPMIAILDGEDAVSLCFCARRSDTAAEAGLETAASYRGRGFGPRVTAAWAAVIRASHRTPLYSTSWENHASLAVARRLELQMYASDWSLQD